MKRTWKVLLATFVAVALICVMVLGVCAVASTTVVYTEDIDATGVAAFDLPVKFKENNINIEAGQINLTWDADVLTATGITANLGTGAEVGTSIEAGKATVAWAGSSITDEEGTLFTVAFTNNGFSKGMKTSVEVEVEALGGSKSFVPFNVATPAMGGTTYVTDTNVEYTRTVAYMGSTTPFKTLVEEALASGENTIIELNADVSEFQPSSTTNTQIGASYASATNVIKVTSVAGGDGTNPYGFNMTNFSRLVFCGGNYVFDYIKLNNNANWSGGGAFIAANNSSITIGHPYNETTGWGEVYAPTKTTVAGHNVAVYTGTYELVGGNFYKTGVTIDSPEVYFGGNSEARGVYGGNMWEKNVTGHITVQVMDKASVTELVGLIRDTTYINTEGADITIDTTGTINKLSYFGRSASRVEFKATAPYTLTINNGTFTYPVHFGEFPAGNYTFDMTTTITGGTFERGAYLGIGHMDATLTGSKGDTGKTNNAYGDNGTWNTTITDGTFKQDLYLYSYCADNVGYVNNKGINTKQYGSTLNANRTVVISGGSFTRILGGAYALEDKLTVGGTLNLTLSGTATLSSDFFGGSNMAYTYSPTDKYVSNHSTTTTITVDGAKLGTITGGSNIPNGKNAVHSGTTTLNIKSGSFTRFYGGSKLSSGTHSGNTTVNITGTATYPSEAYMIGGSVVYNGAVHSGDTAINLYVGDGLSGEITKNNGLYTGCWLDGANSVMSGDSTLTVGNVNGWVDNRFGGSWVKTPNTKHTGNSRVVFTGTAHCTGGETFGGSRIEGDNAVMGSPETPSTSTVEITLDDNNTVVSAGVIYAGSKIEKATGRAYTNSSLILNKGKIGATFSAGSFATVDIPDVADDGISFGFGQIGNATFTVNDGIVQGTERTAGSRVNLDGNLYININGGEIARKDFFLINYGETATSSAPTPVNYSSVTGDVVAKVSGGKFSGASFFNGSGAVNSWYVDEKPEKSGAVQDLTYNVIGGNLYTEINGSAVDMSAGKSSSNSSANGKFFIQLSGRQAVKGDVYFKVIGSPNFANGVFADYTGALANVAGKKYIDLTQYTNETAFSNGWDGRLTRRYEPLNGKTVSIADFDPEAAHVGDLATLDSSSIIYGSYTYTVSELTAFDEYSNSPNAIAVVDATTNEVLTGGLTPTTTAVKIKIGSGYTAPIDVTIATVQLAIAGQNLTLKSDISINFFARKDIVDFFENSYMEFSYTDAKGVVQTVRVATSSAKVDTVGGIEFYRFTFEDMSPEMMGTVVTATLKADGAVDAVKTYSVKEYCMNMITKNTDAKLTTLCVDLLNYGAAAQKYVKPDETNLVNADLTEEQLALGTGNLDPYINSSNTAVNEIADPTAAFVAQRLNLKSKISVVYAIHTTENVAELTVKFTKDEEGTTELGQVSEFVPLDPASIGGLENCYMVTFDGLNPAQLSEVVYATVYKNGVEISNTSAYSVESYAAIKTATAGTLADLCHAIMKYGASANAYAN